MKKRLLTLDDLYSCFLAQDQSFSFRSNDNTSIIVQITESLTFSEDYDPLNGLLQVHLKSCHLYRNRNGSSISEEAMNEAIPSFYNRPILGFIHQLSDGSYDFAGHEFTIDDEGNIDYQEVPVGVIPESCNAQLVYDEEKDKTYLELDGLVYEDYSKAASILREKGECKVSVEISIDELSYSASEKLLNIDKFHFMGVTILGRTIDKTERLIEEGMEGSNVTLSDFSAEKNSMFTNENTAVIEMLESINSKIDVISNFTINNTDQIRKEETTMKDIENFEEKAVVENTGAENVNINETFEESIEVIETESLNTNTVNIPVNYSITYTNGEVKEFALSLSEINQALHTLVNNTYGESDDTYYTVSVYEDGYVLMEDWWSGIAYKQNYKREEDNFSLVGDRVEVFKNYLTKEEENALEEMRKNYSLMEEQLNNYIAIETQAKKDLILNSEDYECIKESEDFALLKSDAANYSIDELQAKCDALLLEYVKATKTFSLEKPNVRKINVSAQQEESYSPYGNLFSNYKK